MFTAAEKKSAVERELSYRRRVYPRRIADGRMTQALADRQIAIFEQILEDYGKTEESEGLI
jgi:hypothetical protein